MSWLTAPYNTLFASAFVMLCLLGLLEAVSLLLGLGWSDLLDDLAGGSEDGAADGSGEAGGGFLAWLEIGKVPLLVSVCLFLGIFSLSGMLLQEVLRTWGPGPLLQPVAAGIVLLISLPVLKGAHRGLGRWMPREESSAFDPELLVGRVGTVTIGTATESRPAEVKVTGPDGRVHYVMCYARGGRDVPQGGELLLVTRDSRTGMYAGELNENPDLSPRWYS